MYFLQSGFLGGKVYQSGWSPRWNFIKMASWSRVSEHLVNIIGMSDQPKRNNHTILYIVNLVLKSLYRVNLVAKNTIYSKFSI